jgi:uncharacterized protein (DUF4415 family)
MPENKRVIGSNLAKVDATTDEDIARQIAEDPDTAPELTDAEWDEGEVWEGNRYLGRAKDFENGKLKAGRPKGSGTKELVTLRLDKDVLARFRAGGPGWQTRLNDRLRAASFDEATAKRAEEDIAALKAAGEEVMVALKRYSDALGRSGNTVLVPVESLRGSLAHVISGFAAGQSVVISGTDAPGQSVSLVGSSLAAGRVVVDVPPAIFPLVVKT